MAGADHVGPCVIRGRLFQVKSWPALVAGAGQVQGDLFRLRHPKLLEKLDAFEHFDLRDLAGSLFIRQRVKLLKPSANAFVYVYNRPTKGLRPVPDGDWLKTGITYVGGQ